MPKKDYETYFIENFQHHELTKVKKIKSQRSISGNSFSCSYHELWGYIKFSNNTK